MTCPHGPDGDDARLVGRGSDVTQDESMPVQTAGDVGAIAGSETGPVQTVPADGAKVVTRTERRVKASTDALRTLLRDLFADRYGTALPQDETIRLNLQLEARPSAGWELRFDPPLAEQLDEQLAEAQAARAVYEKGAIHCFRCDTSKCEHAVPPSALAVFAQYDEIGRPEWKEFQQFLLEAKDDRVDQLYQKPPRVLTCVQFGRQLKGRQLPAFGRSSRAYAILGQVVAGYFMLPRDGQRDPAKLAVTFQAVEARDATGAFRLHLNTVVHPPGVPSFDLLLAGGWQPDLYRARSIALRSFEALERRVRTARAAGRSDEARDVLRQVPGILHRFADAIDRGHRQGQRRTQHVEQRRQEHRPVHKAMDDALHVKPDSVFFDLKTQTLVVCGAKGRTHAFNEAGRHVTSFLIKSDTIDFRLRTERWRRATPDEFESLRDRLSQRADSDSVPTPDT